MDKRIEKTRELIESNFFLLLQKKDISKITVTEICKMANIGRGTFYLHFQDTYDLYDKMEIKLCRDLVQIFEEAYPTAKKEQQIILLEHLTEYIETRKDIFLSFSRKDHGQALFERIRRIFNEKVLWEVPRLYKSEYDVIESEFIVSGIIGVLQKWILNDMKMTREELTKYLSKVLEKFASDMNEYEQEV